MACAGLWVGVFAWKIASGHVPGRSRIAQICSSLQRCCTISVAEQMGRRGIATPSLYFF